MLVPPPLQIEYKKMILYRTWKIFSCSTVLVIILMFIELYCKKIIGMDFWLTSSGTWIKWSMPLMPIILLLVWIPNSIISVILFCYFWRKKRLMFKVPIKLFIITIAPIFSITILLFASLFGVYQ